ncbi:MAG: hypothetical protein LBS60_07490 [Deltaproteobacteria bacterium]|jgi:hypothetical protein|nr:hypothetical protein [Deltaproteobacteria bacterium]
MKTSPLALLILPAVALGAALVPSPVKAAAIKGVEVAIVSQVETAASSEAALNPTDSPRLIAEKNDSGAKGQNQPSAVNSNQKSKSGSSDKDVSLDIPRDGRRYGPEGDQPKDGPKSGDRLDTREKRR